MHSNVTTVLFVTSVQDIHIMSCYQTQTRDWACRAARSVMDAELPIHEDFVLYKEYKPVVHAAGIVRSAACSQTASFLCNADHGVIQLLLKHLTRSSYNVECGLLASALANILGRCASGNIPLVHCVAKQLVDHKAVNILKDVLERADQRQQAFYPRDNSGDGLPAVYMCLMHILALHHQADHRACQQMAHEAALALQDLNAGILQPAQESRHSGTEWYKLVAKAKKVLESLPQLAAQSAEAIHTATAQEE